MPEAQAIPFVGPAYEAISLPFSAQQCINLYFEDAQRAARSEGALIGTPGLEAIADLETAPVRGLHEFDGFLYAVSGITAFKIDSVGNVQTLGTIDGMDRVSIENNRTQVCFVNGSEGFIYTPASDVFEQITDPDFRPAQIVQYLDGYFLFNETDTENFFISALNNGLAYNALDFGVPEGSPDKLISLLADHRDLLLFGSDSIELWTNTGNADFPFEVQEGVFIERGCAAAFSPVKMDNQVYWLGEDRAVYRLEGYLPAKVSTYAIDERIRQYERVDDAFAFTYTEDGHFFYVLTFPSGNETWIYDSAPQGGAWHQRSSNVLEQRWRSNAYARAFGMNIIGDFDTGKLFEMSLETFTDDGNEIRRVRTTMPEHGNERPIFMSKLQVTIQSGPGTLTGQGQNPIAALQWSDDGGRTYKAPRFREMGKIGEYARRVIWRRLGRFRNRTFKYIVTDPIRVVVIAASTEYEAGF